MKKRILACLLALVMLIGAMPVMALAAEPEAENWEVSKSKTATALDADGSTRVTLSLPSAEEKLASDVVFVLDTSSCVGEVMEQVSGLVTDLKTAQAASGADINVGVVVFKGSALPMFDGKLVSVEDAETTLTEMNNKIQAVPPKPDGKPDIDAREQVVLKYLNVGADFIYKGSNLHAGLLGAQELLEANDAVADSRKYVVTVTDAMTYYWEKDGRTYAIYNNGYSQSANRIQNLFYGWQSAWGIGSGYTLPSGGLDWESYIKNVRERIKKDNGVYDTDIRALAKALNLDYSAVRFVYGYEAQFKNLGYQYVSGYKKDDCSAFKDHALGVERSVVECLDAYREMVGAGYQCYALNPTYGEGTFPYLFISKLNEMAGKMVVDFTSIQNDILYVVSAGSTVEDVIGKDFDFVSVDELTVGGKALAATKAATPETGDTATYYFGAEKGSKDGTKYPFVLHYVSDINGETLIWDINVDVTNFAHVQLKYTLKLTNPKTAAGTYGVNDLNGDGKEDATGKGYDPNKALYTNENAYLFPMDSTHNKGEQQAFPKPSVAVDENAIPDYLLPILSLNKATPKLNTRDHFAYVQGYPDGTVKPAGSITRAEVAAILFRLMDADSRSLYYSTASGFRDVDSAKWYNTYVATLNNAGVITDSRTGYFRPNDAITRAELAAMLAQFAEKKSAAIYFSDISAGYWAANAIALTANLGWINGYPDGTFGPDKTVTRAELMAMVNRATGRAPKSTSALLSGMKTWKDNADTARWYYLDVQEATNSHTYLGAPTETWTSLTATPDWSQYE